MASLGLDLLEEVEKSPLSYASVFRSQTARSMEPKEFYQRNLGPTSYPVKYGWEIGRLDDRVSTSFASGSPRLQPLSARGHSSKCGPGAYNWAQFFNLGVKDPKHLSSEFANSVPRFREVAHRSPSTKWKLEDDAKEWVSKGATWSKTERFTGKTIYDVPGMPKFGGCGTDTVYKLENSIINKYKPLGHTPRTKANAASQESGTLNSPRSRKGKTKLKTISAATAPPFDLSFLELSDLQDILQEDEEGNVSLAYVDTDKNALAKKTKSMITTTLWLSNNSLTSIANAPAVFPYIFKSFSDVKWLDLSFNQLHSIEEVLFEMPNLSTLYLHCNNISRFAEVEKLKRIPKLLSVTLQGNPVEATKNYKFHMITLCPSLKKLDFCSITPADREKAQAFMDERRGRMKRLRQTNEKSGR